MSTTTPGERDRKANPFRSMLEEMCIQKAIALQQYLRQQQHVEHSFEGIPKPQHTEARNMITVYRDDKPGAYTAAASGAVVDLKLPVLYRRDLKLLMRYPEPRRTATWIRMSFVADDSYMASSHVLYKAYFEALTPLKNRLDRKTPLTTPTSLLLSPDEFVATLEKQIEGCEPYMWTGKDGTEERTTRGVRARAEALTFPSTNRKRDLRQLQYYKKKGDLVYPEGDPNKRSTFSKWLARDPLFMLPSETQSPFVDRLIADSAKYDGVVYYDGKETEDPGFPGVGIEKKSRKGKERKKGSSQDSKPNPSSGGAMSVGAGQTDAQFEASLAAEWAAALKEQSEKARDKTTTGESSKNRDSKLLPSLAPSGAMTLGQAGPGLLASMEVNLVSVASSESIDKKGKGKGKEQGGTQGDQTTTGKSVDKPVKEQGGMPGDQATTGDRSSDVAIQRFAADIGWNPSSTGSTPLQDGLFQFTALEGVVTRAEEKKKPEAGAGQVSKRDDWNPTAALQTVPRAGRVRKHTDWDPSSRAFAVAPETKRETASKLGNKKWALVSNLTLVDTALAVKHTGLGTYAKDVTSDVSGKMKYDHPGGAIGFIEKLDHYMCDQTRRTMHQTVELQRIRSAAKSRGADASKVEDAAPAPMHSTFMELALRSKGA